MQGQRKPYREPAYKMDPVFAMKGKIRTLLEDMTKDYTELAKSGTYLTYRLAMAKHCAEAKGILHVLAACEASRFKEDIL
jgi:hypothetical protein